MELPDGGGRSPLPEGEGAALPASFPTTNTGQEDCPADQSSHDERKRPCARVTKPHLDANWRGDQGFGVANRAENIRLNNSVRRFYALTENDDQR